MLFQSISFRSYRNIVDSTIDVRASKIFLIGENGQGKTNFLDAAYTLCFGSSFRTVRDADAIRRGSDGFALLGDFGTDPISGGSLRVEFRDGRKIIKADEKMVRDRKDLVERHPAVVFCHSDIEFALGEPERRRFFFDQTACLAWPAYIDLLRNYRRVLKIRNASLRERRKELLDVLDEQLAEYGMALMDRRAKITAEFAEVFSENYETVSRLGQKVSIEYRPSWKHGMDRHDVLQKLASRRDDEVSFGSSLSGPHRDRFAYINDGGDFTVVASTGQSRLLSLLLRVAQADYCRQKTGISPILLFDDVLLELDPEKRMRFMEVIPEYRQAFFTFLPGEPYEAYRSGDTLVYWVSDGKFTRKVGS